MSTETDKNVSDEMLMALADGELTGPDASKLLARIKANPALAARYARFTDTAAILRQAMDSGPVPDHLIASVLTTPTGPQDNKTDRTVVPLRGTAGRPRIAVWPIALAASLMLAVGIGGFLTGRGMSPPAAGLDTAASVLAHTATGGSVLLGDGGTARALGTFQTDLGLCRLIVLESATGQTERAITCKSEADVWQIALRVTEGGQGMFLPASDMAVGLVDDFLDGIGAGAALSPDEELRALAQ
jgi:hypothetical protein